MLGELTGLRASFSLASIEVLFSENLILGTLFFCLAFSLGNLLYVPGWIFLVAAVLALGKEWGGATIYIAALISATIVYFFIDLLGRGALRGLNSKIADKIFSKIDQYPILSVAALRLIFQTAPPLNYALAMSQIKFHHYLIGTIIGLPIPIFAYCYFFEFIFQNALEAIN